MVGLEDLGGLALGSRLRRLSEQLYDNVDRFYQSQGYDFPSRAFPLFMFLADDGALSVSELGQRMGVTHSAVSQMTRKLKASGWIIDQADSKDRRRRLLALSEQGQELVAQLQPLWRDITGGVADILKNTQQNLLHAISDFEQELSQRPLEARIQEQRRQRLRSQLTVRRHQPGRDDAERDFEAFAGLNTEWLEKYFRIEAIDAALFADVQGLLIDKGGELFLAEVEGQIVGACALCPHACGALELTKMAVTESFQGLGFGRALLQAAIDHCQAQPGQQLFLETNSRLRPAIRLYEKLGFVTMPFPEHGADYDRADVYMEYKSPVRA